MKSIRAARANRRSILSPANAPSLRKGLDPERWSALCGRLGLGHAGARFGILATSYGEPHRHYHDARHVRDCLALLDEAAHLAERPDEVELAIWLHDIVYRPLRRGNEERSARVAEWWLAASGAAVAVIGRVCGLILATRHDAAPGGRDEALIQDVDLGILGSSPERYAGYERQIRREYRWVPGSLYRRRRADLLRRFLERGRIYRTEWFHGRFEAAARRNLESALRELIARNGPPEAEADRRSDR